MRLRPPSLAWLAGGALALLGAWHALIAPLAPLARLDTAADDGWQQWQAPAATPHPDIVIVDLDEPSLLAVGHWPWPRERLAALSTELLQRQQVAALGLDLVFPEPAEGDAALAAAWQGRPVVPGSYLTADRGGHRAGQPPRPLFPLPPPGHAPAGWPTWNGLTANTPPLADAAPGAGFFNVLPDADGLVRSVPAAAALDGQVLPSLALALARQASGLPPVQPVWGPAPAGQPRPLDALRFAPAGSPARLLPLDERGQLRIPFRGRGGPGGGSFRYLSAAQVLAGSLPPGQLRGQIVLVGSSAPGLGDLRPTPVHAAMPGVEVHAHLLAGLLDGTLLTRPAWAPAYEAGLIALTLLAVGLAGRLRSPLHQLAALAALAAALLALQAGLRHGVRLQLPLASALALGSLYAVLLTGRGHIQEWRRRRDLTRLFDQYLPPERARDLVAREGPQPLEASNQELTVLFCDLRGFSALGEQLPPLALRDLLNQYFSTVTAIVHAHGGTLDKFIGDAVMAFWGAPQPQADHAARAVRAAQALAQAAGPLNARLAAQGLPPVAYGIGLATGIVCVGDLGSALRRTYTAVGDAVNLAARLEALTRATGVDLLVADSTRQACGPALDAECLWLEVDECQVRGRQQSVTVFTPLPAASPLEPTVRAQVHTWALALHAARGDDPVSARAHLAELDRLSTPPLPSLPAPLSALRAGLLQRLAAAPATP